MSKKIKMEKLSSEEIINMFEVSFGEVASLNNIDSFTVRCSERKTGEPVKMEIDITGLAGAPTIDAFRKGKVEGCDKITISRDDIGSMTFKLLPKETAFLSGNDYVVVYESI